MAYQAREIAFGLGLEGDVHKKAVKFLMSLYKAFRGLDASVLEINPCLITEDGDVLALDAKVNLDDNALFRHKDLVELRDLTEEAPLEVEASKFGLNYIKLDGNVGCMVNGAGVGDGHHGYHPASRQLTGQLPRRWRGRRAPSRSKTRFAS